MTKVLRKKPGPKSSKQSRIVSKRGTLGESSDSNSDDSNPENTVEDSGNSPRTPENRGSKKTQDQNNGHLSEFRTPDAENDATDYGLEFSTSHIPNPSPRRCSTLRNAQSSQEEQSPRTSMKENDTPPLTKLPTKSKPLKKATQQKPKATTKPKSATSAPQAQPVVSQPIQKKARKQRNPLQLEQRFWKDVQKLQSRKDLLIPMMPFSRLIRELMHDTSTQVTKITPTALEALQTSAEMYLTQILQDAYMLTLHRGRVTLDAKDMQLINYLKLNL